MRNSIKQTKNPKLSLLSLQKTKPHLVRILSINSMKLWMTLHLEQFPVSEPCELSPLMNNSKNYLSFFHLNISSLPFHIEELSTLISEHKLAFDIFGVNETKLRLNKASFNSFIICGYNVKFTATECSSSGAAI